MRENRSGSDSPDLDEIAELRGRTDAGDRGAAGRIGEVLAGRGDLKGAVQAWQVGDAVRYNPAGLHHEYLATLSPEEFAEQDDEPEDWSFIESESLMVLLARQGDQAAIARMRARAAAGDAVMAKLLSELPDRPAGGHNGREA